MRWFRQRVELLREMHHLEAANRALVAEVHRLKTNDKPSTSTGVVHTQSTAKTQGLRASESTGQPVSVNDMWTKNGAKK